MPAVTAPWAARGVARPAWPCPPARLHLRCGDVDVWRVRLGVTVPPAAWAMLSPDELGRARRLMLPQGRRDFTIAHAALRDILARYTGVPPGQLEFRRGRYGKPRLASGRAGQAGYRPVAFNLSHTDGCALIAVTAGSRVGVDVEAIRDHPDVRTLAARYLTPAEIAAVTDDDPAEAFFRYWTAKESYVKGRGTGLTEPLDEFEVHFDGRGAGQYTRSGTLDQHWRLCELRPYPRHVAVVAFKVSCATTPVRLGCWTWCPGARAAALIDGRLS